MIFPIRSPQWIILGGGILIFYLAIPSHGQFLGSPPAQADPIWGQSSVPQANRLLLSQSSTSRSSMLPQAIADKILQDLAQRTDQPPSAFKIQSSEKTQWPNSCLGLAKPDEFCAQMITPGWRVEVNDGKKVWIYRTDQRGKNIRLESAN
ncbi:MAG: hypothetical protein RLZZ490_618 [Cyanobacteriota bacterium]